MTKSLMASALNGVNREGKKGKKIPLRLIPNNVG